MAPVDDVEGAAKASPLWARYGQRAEAQSAREMLAGRMADAAEPAQKPAAPRPRAPRREPRREPAPTGGADAVGDFLTSREGKALQRKVMRGVFGMLRKRF
jgi:hypothetical protein